MRKINVLVVETNGSTSNQIRTALEKSDDYNVFVIKHSFADLVNVIENKIIAIAIIEINFILDFNSFGVSKYLDEIGGIPYIFIADNAEKNLMNRVVNSKSSGILIKPFKITDLKATIQIAVHDQSDLKTFPYNSYNKYLNGFKTIPPVLRSVLIHIEDNIAERIEIEDLVKITGWSRFHFTKVFTKSIGIPPKKYIIERKIEISKKLLKNNSFSIHQISNMLNFKSQSDFSRTFKKITGNPPEKYRKSCKVFNNQ
ncbi:helix-turn-helix domain-containing protein [Flavobacterium sp.]|jgi:AraC-like DNA-binding protein|uniref:helix-turn-helix domain-containing protein n=1 Tax=Flavobacterium sp. TaxID=239 RepID=UPI003783EBB1